MKVAVASYRGKPYVYLGHFGDAEVYKVYECSRDRCRLVDVRGNPFRGEHVLNEEDELKKRPKVLELIGDVDAVIAIAFGKGGKEFMERHGKKVFIVPARSDVEDALKAVINAVNHPL